MTSSTESCVPEFDLLLADSPSPCTSLTRMLRTPLEFTRYCPACDGEHIFCANRICASGHVGYCTHCLDERIVPFTRTSMEAA